MSYPYKFAFYKNDVVGSEASPNSSAPDPSRITQAPGDSNEAHTGLLWIGDGTSLVVTVWFFDETSNVWIQLTSLITLTTEPVTFIEVPPSAKLFIQLGANTGSVTKFGLGFVSGDFTPVQGEGAAKTQIVDGSGAAAFPAVAAPADAMLNTTTLSDILAWLVGFNGTSWDRIRSGVTAINTTFT